MKKLAKIINLDEYRRKKRMKGKTERDIDLEQFQINCKKCPIAKDCFWFIKWFKRRLCPFKRVR
jgi:hypothetical protein